MAYNFLALQGVHMQARMHEDDKCARVHVHALAGMTCSMTQTGNDANYTKKNIKPVCGTIPYMTR